MHVKTGRGVYTGLKYMSQRHLELDLSELTYKCCLKPHVYTCATLTNSNTVKIQKQYILMPTHRQDTVSVGIPMRETSLSKSS